MHRGLHFDAARLAVRRMSPVKTARRFGSWSRFSFFSSTASIHRETVIPGFCHHDLRRELLLDPFVVDTVDGGEMLPRARRQRRNSRATSRGSARRPWRPAHYRGRDRCCSRRRRHPRSRAQAEECMKRERSYCRWYAVSVPWPTRLCWAGFSPSSQRRRALRPLSCRLLLRTSAASTWRLRRELCPCHTREP